ncbi:hypothetical protein ACB098_01G112400 [Castanea mollissima]
MNNTTFALPLNLEPDQQLIATTLVGLQSVLGFIILYGGAVKKKWAGYRISFGDELFVPIFLGTPNFAPDEKFLFKISSSVTTQANLWSLLDDLTTTNESMIHQFGAVCGERHFRTQVRKHSFYQLQYSDEDQSGFSNPNSASPSSCSHCRRTHQVESRDEATTSTRGKPVYFQFVFAAITLILIAGALLGRMNFYAWMFFVPLWLTFSYTIGAFTIWSNNGFLYKLGIIDYSGGFVIHLSSGVAGFYSSILGMEKIYPVGPRLTKDRERFPPNNILLMLTGAGFLWMVNVGASLAVLNTHVCTATSLLTWVMLDVYFFGKASIIGTIQGMITGLVCITPAAGVVQGWAAIIMGVCSGSIPWFTMMIIHKKSKLLQMVNDTMAVLHTHAIAGCLGGILTGLFAEPKLNNLFFNSYGDYVGLFYPIKKKNVGLFYGFEMGNFKAGFRQMGIQLLGILFIVKLNIVITSMICILVQFVVPLRMSDEDTEIGDEAAHNEEAYAIWGQGEKLGKLRHEAAVYNDIESSVTKSRAIGQVEMT